MFEQLLKVRVGVLIILPQRGGMEGIFSGTVLGVGVVVTCTCSFTNTCR